MRAVLLELLLLVPLGGTQKDARLVLLAGQNRLRERRTLIGQLTFRANED
jgi:hypothetical protein